MTVIESNNRCIKKEIGIWRVEGLSMIKNYIQVESVLGLHLRYLQIL